VRLTAAEKSEVIRLVEGSDLSVRQTLRELQVPRATFYTWYRRYAEVGIDGLAPQPSAARRHWNRIPPRVRQRVVAAALAAPERTGTARRASMSPMTPASTRRRIGDGDPGCHDSRSDRQEPGVIAGSLPESRQAERGHHVRCDGAAR
jgi:hypothetical protein